MRTEILGNQAVVIGGSMVGMLAARVLSERFRSVVVLDRDAEPGKPVPHRSVPQGAHIHVLLSKGRTVIDRLFPGIFPELEEAGALNSDSVEDLAWFHTGVWKARGHSGIDFYLQSRPLLDWHVRRRLLADCPNVSVCNDMEAESLIDVRGKITGLMVRSRKKPEILRLDCDLLVDASGRGTRMPRWLRDLGYDVPEEQKVVVNISYTTRLYEQPSNLTRDWSAMMIYPSAPEKKLGYIYPVEPDPSGKKRWIVTLAGVLGEHAPTKETGFLEYAKTLARPDIYDMIRTAKPLSNFSAFKFPATRRLRYDRCQRLPEGFVAVGDALASFNPIYGQGMSVGATAVELLERCLQKAGLVNLSKRYFSRAYWLVTAIPWLLVTAEDFRFEETVGKRPWGLPILHWYLTRVHRLAAQDSRITAEFLKVLHFINTPAALFQPYIFLRVIGSALGLYRPALNPRPESQFLPLPPGAGLQARLQREAGSNRQKLKPAVRSSGISRKKKTGKAGRLRTPTASSRRNAGAKKSAKKSSSKSASKTGSKSRKVRRSTSRV